MKKKNPTKFFSLRKVKARRKPFGTGAFRFKKFQDGLVEAVDLRSVVFFKVAHLKTECHKIVFRPAVKREVRLLEEPHRRVTSVELMGGVANDGETRFADHFVHVRLDLF